MNNKELEKLKQEYNDITTALNNNFKEITELEQTPLIKRYLYLKYIQEHFTNDDYSIIPYLIKKCANINETKNFYVYMFENTISRLEILFNIPILESEKDKNKIVVYYVDLENPSRYEFILKENQEEFEKNNIVLTGKETIYDASDRYHNLRFEFYSLCLKQDQEQATQKVLQKYRRREEK